LICNGGGGGGGGLVETLERFFGKIFSLIVLDRVLGLLVSLRSFNFAVCCRVLGAIIGSISILSFSSFILFSNEV
jgi:hypothetical protein